MTDTSGSTGTTEHAPDPTTQLMLLVDPAWRPDGDEPDPPVEALLGGWTVDERGRPGLFQPNPAYRPRSPDSPTDPVDAVLRRLAAGAEHDEHTDALRSVLRSARLAIAVDDGGTALVRPAPDGRPCVLVATAHAHRELEPAAPQWKDLSIRQLSRALPAHGIDVLVNPSSPATMLLLADTVRTFGATDG